MERRKEEKILWINSSNQELYPYYNSTTGTYENIITNPVNNKFDYNIGNILYVDNYKKLSVEMIECAISKTYHQYAIGSTGLNTYAPIPFYSTVIKIYINFNVVCNSIYNNNSNGLLMGIISDTDVNVRLGTADALNELYYTGLGSAKLASDNKIKYYLENIPTGIININIFNQVDEVLEDYEGNAPDNVLLCLKFKYEF